VVEELSILTSDHRRKKPRKLPRPGDKTKSTTSQGMGKAVAVLMGSRRKVMGQ